MDKFTPEDLYFDCPTDCDSGVYDETEDSSVSYDETEDSSVSRYHGDSSSDDSESVNENIDTETEVENNCDSVNNAKARIPLRNKYEKLKHENEHLREQYYLLQENYNQAVLKNEELVLDISQLKEKYKIIQKNLEKETKDYEQINLELEKNLKFWKDRRLSHVESVKLMTGLYKRKEVLLEQCEQKNIELRNESENLRSQLQELERNSNESLKDKEIQMKLQNKNEELSTQLDTLGSNFRESLKDKENLKNKIAENKLQLSQTNDQLTKEENNIQMHTVMYKELIDRKDNIIKGKNEELKRYKINVSQKTSRTQRFIKHREKEHNNEVNYLRFKLKRIGSENHNLHYKCQDINTECHNWTNHCRNLSNKCVYLENQIRNQTDQQKKKENTNISNLIVKYKNIVSDQLNYKKHIEEKLTNSEKLVKSYLEELNEIKSSSYNKTNKQLQKENQVFYDNMKELEQSNVEKTEILNELRNQIFDLTKEIDEMKEMDKQSNYWWDNEDEDIGNILQKFVNLEDVKEENINSSMNDKMEPPDQFKDENLENGIEPFDPLDDWLGPIEPKYKEHIVLDRRKPPYNPGYNPKLVGFKIENDSEKVNNIENYNPIENKNSWINTISMEQLNMMDNYFGPEEVPFDRGNENSFSVGFLGYDIIYDDYDEYSNENIF